MTLLYEAVHQISVIPPGALSVQLVAAHLACDLLGAYVPASHYFAVTLFEGPSAHRAEAAARRSDYPSRRVVNRLLERMFFC